MALGNETAPETHPYGVSLDFKKAFDSVDWTLSSELLHSLGLPNHVLKPLSDMWNRQTRWCTFGRAVAASPIQGVQAILQGDPFGPLAMAVLLAPVIRRIQVSHPATFQAP